MKDPCPESQEATHQPSSVHTEALSSVKTDTQSQPQQIQFNKVENQIKIT
jgi:hypothetical protein